MDWDTLFREQLLIYVFNDTFKGSELCYYGMLRQEYKFIVNADNLKLLRCFLFAFT